MARALSRFPVSLFKRAWLLAAEREECIAFTRPTWVRHVPEKQGDEEKNQHDADKDHEEENVHSFAGVGGLVRAAGDGRESVRQEAVSIARVFSQQQREQSEHLAGAMDLRAVVLRLIDKGIMSQLADPLLNRHCARLPLSCISFALEGPRTFS